MLRDKNHTWKAHVVSEELLPYLQRDLAERYAADQNTTVGQSSGRDSPDFTVDPVLENTVGLDLPGMMMATRTLRTVVVDGLTVSIPSQDWSNILSNIKLEAVRKFSSGVEYYKVHDRFYCLTLSIEQRNMLVEAMEAQSEVAEIEADADDSRLAEAINEINAKVGRKLILNTKVEAINQAAEGKKGSN